MGGGRNFKELRRKMEAFCYAESRGVFTMKVFAEDQKNVSYSYDLGRLNFVVILSVNFIFQYSKYNFKNQCFLVFVLVLRSILILFKDKVH